MVSFTNNGVIGILMRRNVRFSATIIIERLTDSTRTRINAAHVIVEIVAIIVIVRIVTLRPMEVLHGKIHVRYNNGM